MQSFFNRPLNQVVANLEKLEVKSMAENVIDTLSLEIESNAHGAEASIEKLAGSLIKLSGSLKGIDSIPIISLSNSLKNLESGNAEKVASAISALKNSLSGFGSVVADASSIQKITSSMQRIVKIDTGNLENKLPSIVEQIKKFVSGLADIESMTFDATPLKTFSVALSTLSQINSSSLSDNISKLKRTLEGLRDSIQGIEFTGSNIESFEKLAYAISKLGGAAAGRAASGNIEKLGIALKQMMTTLSTAPKVSQNLIQMTTAMAQLASNGSRVQGVSANVAAGFGRIGPAASGAKKHTLSLAAAFGKFYATYWLILRALGQFKKAIDISSDLTEVQNVVDVTFGDMKQKVEDLAATSIQDFGMSELTAKQIASRFQAMGMAMGFAQDEMSDMSIELTKLAADMASFYNMEQADVAKKLQSIFTGESEPLRSLGLDLTNATIQAWALAQGMDVNVNKMTQIEKAALRYQYVLANIAAAQGDFANTSMSWANQLRILTQQFQQLGGIVGGVLINAFKPFISALNSVMQSVIKFAQTVANALGAIFGWTIEINSGGLANDFEAAGAGAEEMDKGTGGAAKNLKDMNKFIAAWHEVNNMTTSDDSGGGGGGGGGAGGGDALGDAAEAQFKRTEGILDKYKSEIDSLYDLGSYIGKVLTDAMDGINWDKVYAGAKNFGIGLARFLNGLISPELFGAVGRTIAGALNTAIYAALSFGTEFDWRNFGDSIAAGINEFFRTFDLLSLADAINVWSHGILDAMISAIKKVKWKDIGTKIGEFLERLDFTGIGNKVGKLIWEAINAGIVFFKGMFDVAPIETSALLAVGTIGLVTDAIGLLANSKIAGIVSNFKALKESLKLFSSTITPLGIAAIIGGIVVALDRFGYIDVNWEVLYSGLEKIAMALGKFVSGIGKGLISFIDSLARILSPAIETLVNGLATALNFFGDVLNMIPENAISGIASVVIPFLAMWELYEGVPKLISKISNSFSKVFSPALQTLGNIAVGYGDTGSFLDGIAYALGPSKLSGIKFTLIAGGILAIATAINSAVQADAKSSAMGQFSESLDALVEDVSEKTEQIKQELSNTRESMESVGVAETQVAKDLAAEYENLSSKSSLTATEQERLKTISQQLVDLVPGLSGYIDEQTGYLDVQNQTLDSLIANMDLYAKQQASQSMLVDAYREQYEAQKNVKDAQDGYNEALKTYLDNAGIAPGIIEDIKNAQLDLNQAQIDFENSPKAFEEKYGVKSMAALKEAYYGLSDSMSEYYTTLEDAQSAETMAAENLEFAHGVISETTDAISKNNEKINETVKASPEFQQALRDISTEFSNLDETISSELSEKLAFDMLDGEQITESITRSFAQMKDGVKLGTEELSTLFSQIAPETSNAFITALSQQDAEMQSSVSMTLANLSAGAEVPIEKLKEVFKTIGYDLPNETIKGFQEQGPEIQFRIVELLSRIDEGYSQSAPQLLELFSELGWEVPQSLIDSLSSNEATSETQKAAIDLIGILEESAEEKKVPVETLYSSLGTDTINSLITSISNLEGETKNEALNLIGQILVAEEEQRGPLIEALKQLGIDLSEYGLVPGIKSGESETTNAMAGVVTAAGNAATETANSLTDEFFRIGKFMAQGLANGIKEGEGIVAGSAGGMVRKAVKAVRTEADEHSPSKVFAELGRYIVKGFNVGIEGETSETYALMSDFVNRLSSGFNFQPPQLDLSIPDIDFSPKSYDIGKFQSTMQMEMDAKMASLEFENRQLRETLEAILVEVRNKQLIVGDRDIFNANRRETIKFGNRTKKDPYPVYGKS